MSNEGDYSGRIVAGQISAENVVAGLQSFYEAHPSELLALARGIRAGSIDASEIQARNVVSGVQLVGSSTNSELIAEVRSLRTSLQQLEGADVEQIDEAEHEDALSTLDQIENSLGQAEPVGSRISRLARNVNDIIDNGASAAEKAGKLTTTLSGVAVQAAALWQSIQHLFG